MIVQLHNSSRRSARWHLRHAIFLGLAVFLAISSNMVAQTASPTTASSSAPTSTTTNTTDTAGSATANETSAPGSNIDAATGSRIALPAGQIIAILQEKPEVVIELKSLLADMLQQRSHWLPRVTGVTR